MDRARSASKNRRQQLKRWIQYDKSIEREEASRIKKGVPVSRKGPKTVRFSQNLVLLEAGIQGDTEEVKRLLRGGVCADVANCDGLTALHQAAINNNLDLCRLLLNYSANVNARDKEQWTPLHAAASCGHKEVCLLLIRSGANMMALNNEENMPYDICVDEGTLTAIEDEMASKGITQDMINEARTTPERTMLQDLQTLVSTQGVPKAIQTFTQLDKQGANCLHVAAACGYASVTNYLASLEMPLDVVDKDGWQALHVAAVYNQLMVIKVLVSHGANIEAQTKQGETAFGLVYGKDMSDKLMSLKKEAEKFNGNQSLTTTIGVVRKRSNANPRSASIRRTSTKEKSNLSWAEARQEAKIRMTVEGNSAPSPGGRSSPFEGVRKNSGLETAAGIVPLESDNSKADAGQRRSMSGNFEKTTRKGLSHTHPYKSPTRDSEVFEYKPMEETLSTLGRPNLEQPRVRPSSTSDKTDQRISSATRFSQENIDVLKSSTRSLNQNPRPSSGPLCQAPRSSSDTLSSPPRPSSGTSPYPAPTSSVILSQATRSPSGTLSQPRRSSNGTLHHPHRISGGVSHNPATKSRGTLPRPASSKRSSGPLTPVPPSHTTPIVSARSSPKVTPNRPTPKSDPESHQNLRLRKPSKPHLCCLLM